MCVCVHACVCACISVCVHACMCLKVSYLVLLVIRSMFREGVKQYETVTLALMTVEFLLPSLSLMSTSLLRYLKSP